MNTKTRKYDSSKRKAQAEARREKILKSAAKLLAENQKDEFRLEDVAQEAGGSVQTILRAFGSKDGLLVKTLEYEAPAALDFSVYSNIKIEDLDQLVTTLFKINE